MSCLREALSLRAAAEVNVFECQVDCEKVVASESWHSTGEILNTRLKQFQMAIIAVSMLNQNNLVGMLRRKGTRMYTNV
jgi:hypothetical protein